MNWPDKTLVTGIARAFGGALIFGIPMLMTMELWALGHVADPLRLAILLGLTPILLFGLARYVGFRESSRPIDHVADSLVAIGVAATLAAFFLFLFGLFGSGKAAREVIGMIGIQIVPGSIGAMLSRSQLGEQTDGAERRRKTNPAYLGELFLMFVGALFLSLSIAPTEEVMHIAHVMPPWREIALLVTSVGIMHVFVYFVQIREPVHVRPGSTGMGLFLRFTVVGYVIVLASSLFLLWVFGRVDGLAPGELVSTLIVLSFPGAVGAAAARLVL